MNYRGLKLVVFCNSSFACRPPSTLSLQASGSERGNPVLFRRDRFVPLDKLGVLAMTM